MNNMMKLPANCQNLSSCEMQTISGGSVKDFVTFLGVTAGMFCVGLLFDHNLLNKMHNAITGGKSSIEDSMEQGKAEIGLAYEESKPGINAALEVAHHPFQ